MTTDTAASPSAATAGLRREDAARLLRQARRLPSLRAKYADQPDAADFGPDQWDGLPALDKAELNTALDELRSLPGKSRTGAYFYASGGTMAAPRLSLIPGDMFVADILAVWAPLDPDDVLVNLFTPGRLWSAHYFYNALATASGAAVIPFGAMGDDEIDQWLDFFEAQGATALAATPTTIKQILGHCSVTGRTLPGVRKILWVGEAFDARTEELIEDRLPQAEIWGLYGSTETWVIGWNGPNCPRDTFHPLPYQHVELAQDDAILVSNTHEDCVNPLLRYRVGDLGELTGCRCGGQGPALRVLGRADSYFKFLNQLISPEELIAIAKELDDVADAQIVLVAPGGDQERLQVRVRPTAAPRPNLRERARQQVLSRHFELGYVVADAPHTVEVVVVPQLSSVARTAKTPLLIVEPAP
ncbi:AMP-binding protein [Streptacidiphilus melanogenes]|uniref:AMP-binding protein n=1 Tax=Streptacidiphilus melanogenes TaxID=411235 RepID=UPI000694BAF7|nr:AMP-binding protein [Streptacidiphilus melanogenes]